MPPVSLFGALADTLVELHLVVAQPFLRELHKLVKVLGGGHLHVRGVTIQVGGVRNPTHRFIKLFAPVAGGDDERLAPSFPEWLEYLTNQLVEGEHGVKGRGVVYPFLLGRLAPNKLTQLEILVPSHFSSSSS